jgi:hypothetical protein
MKESTSMPAQAGYPIAELRRYTLHPGHRDVLIDVFERHLIESQNEVGMEVLAHYRDLDDPDAFVWFRGFRDMASRGNALPAFYLDGAAWRTHREAANATMADSDDVLLLREALPGSGFGAATQPRAPVGVQATPSALAIVTTYSFAAPVDEAFLDFFDRTIAPAATLAGAKVLAAYASEHSANNFPRLPVREGENVFVWVAGFGSQADFERYRQALADSPRWRDDVQPKLSQCMSGPPAVRRLVPAARSLVRD